MYEIVVQQDADDELNAAAAFYESREEGLGDQFLEEVGAGFQKIQAFPFSWAIQFDDIHSYLMRRFPYRIVYRVALNQILSWQ
jgi:toxin ParE1/3/4